MCIPLLILYRVYNLLCVYTYIYIYIRVYMCIYMYIVRLHVQRPQQHIEIFMVTPATPVPYDVYVYYAHIHVETYGWVNTTSPPTHLLLEERSNPFCKLYTPYFSATIVGEPETSNAQNLETWHLGFQLWATCVSGCAITCLPQSMTVTVVSFTGFSWSIKVTLQL